ncbi:MAG: sensor histidine kinase [Marinicellaceae bacterium]
MNTTKNNNQFWALNIIGWFSYLFLSGIFFSIMQGGFHLNTFYLQSFSFILLIVGCYFLRQLIKSKSLLNSIGSIHTILLLLASTLFIAVICQFLVSMFMMYVLNIMNWQTYSFSILAITIFQSWISIIGWTLIYFIIKHKQKNRLQEIEKWQLETALKEAELQSLKTQLNPHFIFNCLNNIRALAIDDGQKTREMITHLSEILKFMFQFNLQKLVTLDQEINYVKNYLTLESIQFDDRLKSQVNSEANLGQWKIPPMSIQLLVENAIKHGIMHLEKGGEIIINISGNEAKLYIDVINEGQISLTNKKGIGLENLRKRLAMLISAQSTVRLEQLPKNRVKAQLVLIK